MFKLNQLQEKLTVEQIKRLIRLHKSEYAPTLIKMQNYYEGKYDELDSEIAKRASYSNVAANRKIDRNIPEQIVNQFSGYLLGEPITYTGSNTSLIAELEEIDNRNYSDSHNMDIARHTSIFGYAIELLYRDEFGNINYSLSNPINTVLVESNDLDPRILCAIRYTESQDIFTSKKEIRIEVYYDDCFEIYIGTPTNFKLIATEEHEFGDVPVIVYKNNANMIGDYQKSINLITQYQVLLSDIANKTDYTKNVKMIINMQESNVPRNITYVTDDDGNEVMNEEPHEHAVARFIANKTLFTGGVDGKTIEYISPELNKDYDEFALDKFRTEIFTAVGLPDLDNNKFSGNQSGEALKLKMFQTNQIVKNKERYFTTGLRQRVELIANALNFTRINDTIDNNNIEFIFTRGFQIGMSESTENIINAYQTGLISKQTAMARLMYVTDINKELELMNNEPKNNETDDKIEENLE